MKIKGYRRRLFPLYPFFLLIALCAAAYFINLQTLMIGSNDVFFAVKPGDVFIHKFVHSMYDVEVKEKFLIGSDGFTLFHVETSDSALEYYAIEGRHENNVNRRFNDILIPSESMGRHSIEINNHILNLEKFSGRSRHIRIKLEKMPLVSYLFYVFFGDRNGR